ncbi:outer membrane protein [Vibrio splendidus]|uniref:outer membrane protein n=1 Tax=Vibrio splendidus TaxID=29497 RepID=UPI000CC2C9B6|nr:outer membrane beta-barrel protein [Vibrio splendidus]PMI78326.1 hypothetical protein BCU38_22770 [Vibrio splendidus]
MGINKKGLLSLVVAGSLVSSEVLATDKEAIPQVWEGFYTGVALGVANNKASSTSALDYSGGYFFDSGSSSDSGQINPLLQKDLDGTDFTGSLILGFDFRENNLIYGIEADFTLSQFSETNSVKSVVYDTAPTHTFDMNQTIETDYQISLRPKIGYVTDQFQVYLSVGPSIAKFKTNNSYEDSLRAGYTEYSDNETVIGISTSIGAAYMLSDNWAVRGDYVYSNFSDITKGDLDVDSDGDSDIKYSSDFESHNFRLAIVKYF